MIINLFTMQYKGYDSDEQLCEQILEAQVWRLQQKVLGIAPNYTLKIKDSTWTMGEYLTVPKLPIPNGVFPDA